MKAKVFSGARSASKAPKNKARHPHILTRRKFVGKAGGVSLTAGVLTLMDSLQPVSAIAHDATESDLEIINGALAAEGELVAAYEECIKTGLLEPGLKKIFNHFKSHHVQHSNKFRRISLELGGITAEEPSDYVFPANNLTNQKDLIAFVADLEESITISYVDAVGTFADRTISKLVASILAAEAIHWATLDSELGNPLGSSAFVF